MEIMKNKDRYEMYRQAVEDYLQTLFTEKPRWADLYEAMRYSLLSGGKRIRPILTLEFARLGGIPDWEDALPMACATELVHTYSLIHDDLPCMDNDDLRRGKPTNHKAFGETMAVLAGDALQAEAFRLILSAPRLVTYIRANCALLLAKAAGADGMVGGQVLDTLHKPADRGELAEVHQLKTGAMISAACCMGATAAGEDEDLLRAAEEYGYYLGMAFQIRDDMLDVIGNADEFGKPIGSDKEEGKTTYVDLLGLDGCAEEIRSCTEKAKAAVANYDIEGFLSELADSLADRKN